MMVVSAGLLLTPETSLRGASVIIENGVIKEVAAGAESALGGEVIKCEECAAAPGFIDVHTHGYGGVDVTAVKSERELEKLSSMLVKHGVTTYLAATVSSPLDRLIELAEIVRSAAGIDVAGAELAGVYFEGPYLSREKAGAQNPEYLRPPNVSEIRELYRAYGGLMRVMALAPELPGSLAAVRELCRLGVIASAAHTNATFDDAMKAFDAGVKLCTHIFNGMRGFHHREPGIATAALLRDDVYVELIADLIHLHPGTIALVHRTKPSDKVIAITDSISATGLPDGEYELGGLRIVVRDGISRLKESGRLAGSTLTLDRALRNLVFEVGIPLREALKYMTKNPAELLGLKDRGVLRPGYRADIVLLDCRTLEVRCVIVKGEVAYSTL